MQARQCLRACEHACTLISMCVCLWVGVGSIQTMARGDIYTYIYIYMLHENRTQTLPAAAIQEAEH